VIVADTSLLFALLDRPDRHHAGAFDERHFRALRPLWGGDAFTLLPTDAS
jgi:hypothetical protein